jgi:hypothetical protein
MGRRLKAQVAFEFIILIGIGLIMLIIFVSSTSDHAERLNSQRDFIVLKDISYKIQNEINLASQVKEGYKRTFYLPDELDGNEYTITTYENEFKVSMNNMDFSLRIPKINGTIKKGNNTITNKGGVINLN